MFKQFYKLTNDVINYYVNAYCNTILAKIFNINIHKNNI